MAAGQVVTCSLRMWRGHVLSYLTLHPDIAPPPHKLHVCSSRQRVPAWWEHWHIASICHKYNISYTPSGEEEGRGQECQGRHDLSYPTRQPPRFWQRNQVSVCIGYGSVFLPDLKEQRNGIWEWYREVFSWFSQSRGTIESLKYHGLDMELLYLIQSSIRLVLLTSLFIQTIESHIRRWQWRWTSKVVTILCKQEATNENKKNTKINEHSKS